MITARITGSGAEVIEAYKNRLLATAPDMLLACMGDVEKELHSRILDHEAGATAGYDIEGRAIKSNNPKTAKRKLKTKQTYKGKVKSLYATGKLLGPWGYKVVSGANPTVTLFLPRERWKIIQYLAEKGYVNWFGFPVTINGTPTGTSFSKNHLRPWLEDAERHAEALNRRGYA